MPRSAGSLVPSKPAKREKVPIQGLRGAAPNELSIAGGRGSVVYSVISWVTTGQLGGALAADGDFALGAGGGGGSEVATGGGGATVRKRPRNGRNLGLASDRIRQSGQRSFRYNALIMNRRNGSAVLERLLEPVSRSLNVEAARKLIRIKADAKTQARVDELANKCNEGELTPAERAEYERYVTAGTMIAILQAKARLLLKKS